MSNDDAYSWYDGQPQADLVQTQIPDQRRLPVNYPQSGGGRDLSTGCRVDGVWKDEAGNKTCMWGDKSSGDKHRCMYFKFGCMCDKVVGTDGKELN
ncbi:MAG: hypothetical protein ACXADH_05535 [Candidatus Kariarchaeaceae archaeon]|jgi:hypothetical protein